MLRLIALKIYNDCAKHICKCLKPDVYYYFSNDYYFDHQGVLSFRKSSPIPLHKDFYTNLKEFHDGSLTNDVQINISAIVGKNGDGKSSLVEIILRLINNLAESSGIYEHHLQHVQGLRAELVYLYDETIYKIIEESNKGTFLYEYATIKNEDIIVNAKRIIIKKHYPLQPLFYTLISNYSHYAYNVYDFQDEWTEEPAKISNEEKANAACWLTPIFRKNDGYSVPLTILPYRESGNVNINREKSLSKQRLTALFINSTDSIGSFRHIAGNKAVAIRLKPLSYSKLQKRTLEDYFMTVRLDNSALDWAFKKIQGFSQDLSKLTEPALEDWSNNERQEAEMILDELMGYSDNTQTPQNVISYAQYLQQMDKYVREYIPSFNPNKRVNNIPGQPSDIARYLYSLLSLNKRLRKNDDLYDLTEYLNVGQKHKKYGKYRDYNIRQLARIYLIYQIALHYEINPLIVCKPYEELSAIEKGQQYLIYKTISIFQTYPSYKELVNSRKYPWDACYEYTADELEKMFALLNQDIKNDSHITRKLSQTFHYIDSCKQYGDIYNYLLEQEDNSIFRSWSSKDEMVLGLDALKAGHTSGMIQLSELPPPIYESEIVFQRDGSFVGMNSLSSGEKQMLNILGAIIYHLHNIDSGQLYQAITIILEEIELYFHPEYQRQFVYRLIKQIRGEVLPHIKVINILFVTHSPFILSDIPKENVLFLRNGEPDTTMQENTFGANIHSLLKNGFFLPNLPIGEFAYHKINRLFVKLNANEVRPNEIEVLDREITLVGEPYLREQLYRLFYSLPQVKSYYENQTKR